MVSGVEPDWNILRVLVVDDDDLNRRVLAQAIQTFGHRTEAVASGGEALDVLARAAFDVVLMDIRMPGLNGIQTLRAIRETPGPNAAIAAVCVTADLLSLPPSHYLQLGFQAFLPKPVSLEALRDAVDLAKALASAQAGAEGPPGTGARPPPTLNASPAPASRTRGSGIDWEPPGPPRLLVIDRDQSACRLLARVADQLGFEAACVSEATEALSRLKSEPFAAVLLDPKDQGFRPAEFLSWVRAVRGEGAPPVICVSGGMPLRSAQHLQALGFAEYVAKPVNRAALARSLQALGRAA